MPYRLDVVSNAFVVTWKRPEMNDLRELKRALELARSQHERPMVYVAVIPVDSEPPEDPVRKEMMRTMDGMLEHCSTMHFVLEGTGFKHAMARSALSGILLVSGRRGRVFVHRTLAEAIQQAEPTLGNSQAIILRELSTRRGIAPAPAAT
jgi:hypothetical protein